MNRVELCTDETDVVGTDEPSYLGVDLAETSELVQLIELHDGDIASGVLGEEDDVQDADRLVVDQLGQFGRDVVIHVAVGEPDDEILNGSGHGESPLVVMISLLLADRGDFSSQFATIWRSASDRIPDLRSSRFSH